MPMLDPIPRDPVQAVATAAVLWAALQLVLASWRDLAPVTIGVAGSALVLALFDGDAPGGRAYAVVAVPLALVVSAIAQARAARHGVGRPALVGLGIAAVAVGGLLPLWLPMLIEPPEPSRVRALALVPCMLVGAVGGLLALERPAPRSRAPRWVGRIPVEVPGEGGPAGGERGREPAGEPKGGPEAGPGAMAG